MLYSVSGQSAALAQPAYFLIVVVCWWHDVRVFFLFDFLREGTEINFSYVLEYEQSSPLRTHGVAVQLPVFRPLYTWYRKCLRRTCPDNSAKRVKSPPHSLGSVSTSQKHSSIVQHKSFAE